MTRALVLGGGGPVGIGWEAGLIVGLRSRGVDLSLADTVIGTSAGSVIGFTLVSGGDLTGATSMVSAADQQASATADPAVAAAAQGLEQLMSMLAEASEHPEGADAVRARMGRIALESATMSEPRWLDMFAAFAGSEWPPGFKCTAVDTADGGFRVWDGASGVDVQHAVASSCAVPGIFPPVTIGGARWMDGGVRDILNADVAAGHDVVLVVSCTLLEIPPDLSTAVPFAIGDIFSATRAQLDQLRESGTKVETILPGAEMLELSGWGLDLMNFTRADPAYHAGVRQGEAEATRLAGFWAG